MVARQQNSNGHRSLVHDRNWLQPLLEMKKQKILDIMMLKIFLYLHMLSELQNQEIIELRAGLIQHTKCQK
jgi:hypothetical protein